MVEFNAWESLGTSKGLNVRGLYWPEEGAGVEGVLVVPPGVEVVPEGLGLLVEGVVAGVDQEGALLVKRGFTPLVLGGAYWVNDVGWVPAARPPEIARGL